MNMQIQGEWEQVPTYSIYDPCFFDEGDIVRFYYAPDTYSSVSTSGTPSNPQFFGRGPYICCEFIVSREYNSRTTAINQYWNTSAYYNWYGTYYYADNMYNNNVNFRICNRGFIYTESEETIENSDNKIYAVFRKKCTRLEKYEFPETDWHFTGNYGAVYMNNQGKVIVSSLEGSYPSISYLCVVIEGDDLTGMVPVSNNNPNGTYNSIFSEPFSNSGDAMIYLYDSDKKLIKALYIPVA